MSYGASLKRCCESHGHRVAAKTFADGLASNKIRSDDIHVQDLAEHFLGRERNLQRRRLEMIRDGAIHAMEATEAQDASAFADITGQLLVTEVKKGYDDTPFVTDAFFRKIPNPGGNLKAHIIPYISSVVDTPSVIEQGQPYPQTRTKQSWISMPAPEKRGFVCALTFEMIYSDLTGQAQERAREVGKATKYDQESRRLQVALGLTNNAVWNGNTLTTYVATAGTGNYVNKLWSTTITTYRDVASVEQLFWNQVDPITGRLIFAKPTTALCFTMSKYYDLKRIFHATEVRDAQTSLGNATANPLDTQYPVVMSSLARKLLIDSGVTADHVNDRVYWFNQQAFASREVYPVDITPAPVNNQMEFWQDIVLAVKAGVYDVPFVYDPRFAAVSVPEAS